MKTATLETSSHRVRVTANLPPDLAGQLMAEKGSNESMSEAICRLLQMGLLANAAVSSSAALQKNQKMFESIALIFMREVKEIREIVKSLK